MKTDPSIAAAVPTTALLSVFWQPRPVPLAPEAVVARGAVASEIARRLLARDSDSLAALTGVRSDSLIVVIGAAENLPWADGAFYLGRDPAVPGVFLPTTLAPNVPLPILVRALSVRFPNTPLPFAVLPGTGDAAPAVIPLAAARTVDPVLLADGWGIRR